MSCGFCMINKIKRNMTFTKIIINILFVIIVLNIKASVILCFDVARF